MTASVSYAIIQTTPLPFFKSKIIQQLISDLFRQIAFGTIIESAIRVTGIKSLILEIDRYSLFKI